MGFWRLSLLVLFLSFAGAGMILLSAVALDVAGLPSRYMGLSVVVSIMMLLPLTKRLTMCVGVKEETARRVALLIGVLSILLFYLSSPRTGV